MNAKSSANNQWLADQYQLIDFGQGRKLERFGAVILDRPCPAAENARKSDPSNWALADLHLNQREAAELSTDCRKRLPQDWQVRFGSIHFQLRLTPFGHVGLFPEHAAQWRWLLDQTKRLTKPSPSLLNLFAYTGGASLVMASQGWHVTHVDAAEPTVQWARQNALNSGLVDATIRWLIEDARVYVTRELKRGRKYDAILLDPPGYGHGPKGKAWQIDRDLPVLIEQCCRLLLPGGVLVLTGHSEHHPIDPEYLLDLRKELGHGQLEARLSRVTMTDVAERSLDFGWSIRCAAAN